MQCTTIWTVYVRSTQQWRELQHNAQRDTVKSAGRTIFNFSNILLAANTSFYSIHFAYSEARNNRKKYMQSDYGINKMLIKMDEKNNRK